MNKHIQELVSRYGNKVVENRRYLHAHPELSFQEKKRPGGYAMLL